MKNILILYTRMFEIQSLLISQNCHDDFLEQIMIQKEQLVKCREKDIWDNYVDNILTNIHVKKYIQENKNLYHILKNTKYMEQKLETGRIF